MIRYLRIHGLFAKLYLKSLATYKGDFIVGILGVLLNQFLTLFFLKILFSKIPNLNGWSFDQVVFIYAYSLVPKGLDHLFFDNLWAVGLRTIKNGDFDKYLLRPLNSLFQVSVETVQLDALGELIVSIILLFAGANNISWSLANIFIFVITIPFTTLIFTSIKIIAASLAFWTKQSGAAMYVLYMFNDFSKYPISIFNYPIKIVISFIVPFAFTSYYPMYYIIYNKDIVFNIIGLFVISLLLFKVSLIVWKFGQRKYESAGT